MELIPVPPVAVVYHNKFEPVAVKGAATEAWQMVIGLVDGAAGIPLMVTTTGILTLSPQGAVV